MKQATIQITGGVYGTWWNCHIRELIDSLKVILGMFSNPPICHIIDKEKLARAKTLVAPQKCLLLFVEIGSIHKYFNLY